MIEFKNLTVRYRTDREIYMALEDISLTVPDGSTCAVIGPSGCGKSTLLKVAAGIIRDYEGTAWMNGAAINPKKQCIGFIPQNYGLLPWKNVAENIGLGVKIKRHQKHIEAKKLQKVLLQLGLEGLEDRYPMELSGGQQQRVGLARAFLLCPDILLLDEPFSALDAITREDMQDLFLSLWQEYHVSTLFVTHYVEEALYLGQKIVILSARPGRINRIIENPLFGGADIRQQPEFFAMGRELRRILKEDWSCRV